MTIEEIKLLVGLLILLGASSVSAYITHEIDGNKYKALELSYTQAKEKAVETALEEQSKLDEIKTQVALQANIHQQRIISQNRSKYNEVTKYVKSNCLSYGSIRLLDSEVLGRDTESLILPSGKSNDSLSPFTANQLVGSILTNYGIAKQNAKQLDDLIDYWGSVNRKDK